MIAFGVAVAEGAAYRQYSEPGVRIAKEADSEVYVFAAVGHIARSYNLMLDVAARHDDLEAMALVHPHTKITDPDFCPKVREALADPDVAVVGAVGASDVRTIAWWNGQLSGGRVTQHYQEHGGGEVPAFSWKPKRPAPAEVDVVDGSLMVLSRWAVHHLRFDETLPLGHGYDVDFCWQVRAQARKVMTADIAIDVFQSLELLDNVPLWSAAHVQVSEKWRGGGRGGAPDRPEPTEAEWKQRARRAEAEHEAAKAIAYGKALELDARVLGLERSLRATEDTVSWRITQPLRRLNQWRRARGD